MQGFKVLIVDDSPFMQKVFSDVIDADAAFKVLATASNGKEAVDLALKLKPDIITMDLEMPHMNGIEALQRIMAIQPTPVIMLSAVTDNGTRDTIKALQYGAIDFIRKPDGAVRLDIRQVGEQLLEKLHIALETMSRGAFRMLPAVEEKSDKPPPSAHVPAMPTTSMQAEVKKLDNRAETVTLKPLSESKRTVAAPAKPKKPDLARKPFSAMEIRKPLVSPPAPGVGLSKTNPKSSLPDVDTNGQEQASRLKEFKPSPIHLNNEVAAKRPGKAQLISEKPVQAIPTAAIVNKASTAFTQIVAIGTSTGGPRALHEVLTGIPADFPAPILVVQHMPPKFTHSLAQRLDNFCNIQVREAVDGEFVETATAYVAPGGRHMTLGNEVNGKYRIKLSDEGPRGGHMPSVDVMFESLLGHQQLKRHVVLMTGMGSDGAKGMKALQVDGAVTTIAEAEQTCVVYGMPRSAVELGAASHVIPLQAIASLLVQEVKLRKP
jgi:two-component system, chemotaxis family, protein-glutamate methylesterase/glutaminase